MTVLSLPIFGEIFNLRRWLPASARAMGRFLIAVFLCFSPLTSLVVLGWAMRRMRHTGLRGFEKLQNRSVDLRSARMLPPALVFGSEGEVKWSRRWFGGLMDNFLTGLKTLPILVVWVFPFGSLWMWAWWAGWNNSFEKGYEQAAVGPLAGFAGVALFLATMLVLHLALARLAFTSDWRTVFEFSVLRRLAVSTWRGSAGLALVFLSAALVLFVHRVIPLAVAADIADIHLLPESELDGLKFWYGFGGTAVLLWLFLATKSFAARSYVKALAAATSTGSIDPSGLHGREREVLQAGGLTPRQPRRAPTSRWRAFFSMAPRLAVALAAWWGVVVLIFVGQFFNHDWVGWMFYPLFTLPWASWLP